MSELGGPGPSPSSVPPPPAHAPRPSFQPPPAQPPSPGPNRGAVIGALIIAGATIAAAVIAAVAVGSHDGKPAGAAGPRRCHFCPTARSLAHPRPGALEAGPVPAGPESGTEGIEERPHRGEPGQRFQRHGDHPHRLGPGLGGSTRRAEEYGLSFGEPASNHLPAIARPERPSPRQVSGSSCCRTS